MRLCRCIGLAFVALASALLTAAAAQEKCHLETVGAVQVARVIDGRTFALGDGREVRLAGIELPQSTQSARAQAAKAALARLVSGRTVTLKAADARRDRYGRLLAYAFAPNDADQSLNSALLAAGYGRATPTNASKGCAEALLAAEATARAAGRGLWADPTFAPLRADHPARVSAERGRFALVEGKVLSVREAGATIYVNFGRRWTRDFTVIILKRNRRLFAAGGIEPKALQGHRIRVRGVIERRGGPIIEAAHPEQIEIIDEQRRVTR